MAEARRNAVLRTRMPEVRRHIVNPILALRLHRHGIIFPAQTIKAARAAKLGLPVACAMLMMETGGGHNEFGHDMYGNVRAPGWGWGTVTKTKYAEFKAERDRTGRTNGVGSGQLTSISLQNEADKAGGCWIPQHNMAVGFHYLHDLILEHGLLDGCIAYNGAGPAANRYGRELVNRAEWFKAEKCGTLIGIVK